MVFTLVSYKPCNHYTILSAIGHMVTKEKEGELVIHVYYN